MEWCSIFAVFSIIFVNPISPQLFTQASFFLLLSCTCVQSKARGLYIKLKAPIGHITLFQVVCSIYHVLSEQSKACKGDYLSESSLIRPKAHNLVYVCYFCGAIVRVLSTAVARVRFPAYGFISQTGFSCYFRRTFQ